MDFIDTHVHLQDFKPIYTKDIIFSAVTEGVSQFICVSDKESSWSALEELYSQYTNFIIPAFGLHPWHVKEADEDWVLKLEQLLIKYPKALIGEIGLDGTKDPELQIEAFEAQLVLSKKYCRPIIVHAIKAQSWFEKNWGKMPNKFVFHSYNGKNEFLKEIVSHDGYVSFSFSILKNKKMAELVNMVPIDRILIETDSPYQSMEKDGENEPSLLPKLAFEIAKVKNMDIKDFTSRVYLNSLEFAKVD